MIKNIKYTVSHHALLFACLSKAVIDSVGKEKGGPIMRRAVKKYGLQRGRRMALRTKKNQHELTMANFLAYKEWATSKGEMEQEVKKIAPDFELSIIKCPWYQTWKEKDLMEYGKYYCMEIDDAVINGYNPELKLDILSLQADGSESCEFVYHKACLKSFNELNSLSKKDSNHRESILLSWHYHCAHLFKTVSKIIVKVLGNHGKKALQAAMEDFKRYFDDKTIMGLDDYQFQDFDQLPKYK